MKYLSPIAICLIALTGLVSAQTVYESKDAQGNPVFTDQRRPGAKEVELKSINTTPGVVPRPAPAQQATRFAGYSRIAVSVTNPIPNGLAPVTVGIVTEPALLPGHSWQLKLDGQIVASGTGGSATIPRIDRGDHTFSVDVIGDGGNVIGSSDPLSVSVFWPGGKVSPTVTHH